MAEEKWTVSTHSDNLDAQRIKRVISLQEAEYRRWDYIQCYGDSATLNMSGAGVHVTVTYPADVMDAIYEEWQRFRRELAAHEAEKAQS